MVVVAGVILSGNCHLSVYCMHFSEHFIHIIHLNLVRMPRGSNINSHFIKEENEAQRG